jgi:hypothetical protein
MGTGLRLMFLMLTVVLAHNNPPNRPPGSKPGKPIRPEPCPDCGRESVTMRGSRYYCSWCGKPFTPR